MPNGALLPSLVDQSKVAGSSRHDLIKAGLYPPRSELVDALNLFVLMIHIPKIRCYQLEIHTAEILRVNEIFIQIEPGRYGRTVSSGLRFGPPEVQLSL